MKIIPINGFAVYKDWPQGNLNRLFKNLNVIYSTLCCIRNWSSPFSFSLFPCHSLWLHQSTKIDLPPLYVVIHVWSRKNVWLRSMVTPPILSAANISQVYNAVSPARLSPRWDVRSERNFSLSKVKSLKLWFVKEYARKISNAKNYAIQGLNSGIRRNYQGERIEAVHVV
jgi:hypothetical protein